MPITLAVPKKKKIRAQSTRPNTQDISVVSIFDRFSTYPSAGLTPERLTAILREADQGEIMRQSELFEEILEKDLRLFGMFQSRKNAVTKLEYQIRPASTGAIDVRNADFVRDVFHNIDRLRDAKNDILDAVAKGFSMLWIGWASDGTDTWIENLNWVHQKHFRFGKATVTASDLNEIRRLTDENRIDGFELEPNKWIAAVMKARSGHPSRTSILRTNAWMYLFKNFDIKSWIQFVEMYGVPFRLGKYTQTASDADKNVLLQALLSLSTDSAAMISEQTSIQFVEAVQKAAAASMHGELAKYINDEQSIAVLGHTGAAQSTPGQLGGQDNALEVRLDLVESDALALDYILCDQLIVPLIDFKFGPQDKYPSHQTIVQKPINRKDEAEVLDSAVNKVGIPVPLNYAYERLGIPQPAEGEEVIIPRPVVPASVLAGSGLLGVVSGDSKKKAE
jgi:phage gp29-like protein